MNSPESNSSLASSNGNIITTPANGSVTAASSTLNQNSILVELCDSKCSSAYLQSKLSTTFDSVKASLKEATDKKNSSKIYTCLQNLTYYKVDKDFLDMLVTIITISDEKKTLRLAYYFLNEISQFKHLFNTGSAEIKNLINIFSKEQLHKDISRKVISLKTTATVAPNDVLIDANILEVISGILRKVGEDVDKTQKKKGFFSRGTNDLGRERSLLQYACFVACRNRFKNSPSLFMPIIEGIKCSDPVGARHSISLTFDYAVEKPSTVSESTKRFLPLLKANKGKEAVNLQDSFARRNFIKLAGHLAAANVPESKDFFQHICQSVQDNHYAVSFWAIQTLIKFPWSKLEQAIIEPIILDNDTPNHFDILPNQISLVTGICNKIKIALTTHTSSTTTTSQSNPIIHLACKLVALLSESYVKSAYPKDNKTQLPIIGDWLDLDNIPTTTTIVIPTIIQQQQQQQQLQQQPNNRDKDSKDQNPFSSLTSIIMSCLTISPSISIRIQALKALVWLCPLDLKQCQMYRETFKNLLLDPYHPGFLFKELYMEMYKRVIATPVLSPMILSLIYDWIDIVPPKVDTNLICQTLRVIIDFGLEAKEKVLATLFKILDRSVHPDFRVVNLEILKDLIRFLGDVANVLTFESQSLYPTVSSSTALKSLEISNQSLNSIIQRLEQYAIYNPWQLRMESVDALGKIAFQSSTSVRIHIYNFLSSIPNESHGWTCVKSNTSLICNILDQLLTKRTKFLTNLKSSPTLTEQQSKELSQDHHNLLLQISIFFEQLPNDFLPFGFESKLFINKQK
ncbi:hypothetical protein DLAC_10541 [Tieghemostelium lacteum]|uniref:Uncharacterized protein n=1 Tax=Tieghemostelium lacteum TaxID=361077 RepID=A0A151Z4Q6_TIELA|nr:hypothetical protein DLAC_10541 [Tieghemostelium lacteum]|eukprot:KYQ88952.1 hypothetical protein DLAC_10541 [Tieghemostelium lacteum]